MGAIFISYRRTDSREFCVRLASELIKYFGPNQVFFDQTTILPGAKWPRKIRDTLKTAEAVLIVIGPQWLHARDEKSGKRRIDMTDDWVRQEVLTALKRKKRREKLEIIPVLIGNTTMPDEKDFDDELSGLPNILGISLPNTGSHHDFDQLKDQLIMYKFHPKELLPPVATQVIGKIPPQLEDDAEKQFLNEFKEWDIVETEEHSVPGGFRRELHRVYEFPTFDLAFEFMTEVVKRGIQQINHHPRWQNTYYRLEVWLTTFNRGYKPSSRDVKLARIFEQIWIEYKSRIWDRKS